MQQSQRQIKRREQVLPCDACALFVRVLQIRLDPFNIPIAEVAPEKVIDALGSLVEAVMGEGFVDHIYRRGQPPKQPFVCQGEFSLIRIRSLLSYTRRRDVLELSSSFFKLVKIEKNESCRVPDLVRERLRSAQPVLGKRNVGPRCRHAHKHVTQGVGSVFLGYMLVSM